MLLHFICLTSGFLCSHFSRCHSKLCHPQKWLQYNSFDQIFELYTTNRHTILQFQILSNTDHVLQYFFNFTLIPSWGFPSSFGAQLIDIIRDKKYGIKFSFDPSLLLVLTHLLVIAHYECSTIISSCSNSPQNVSLKFIYRFIQTGDI